MTPSGVPCPFPLIPSALFRRRRASQLSSGSDSFGLLALGVGSTHSTSSARVGPWPPFFLLSGCWLPPLLAMFDVGVLSSGAAGQDEGPVPAVRRTCFRCAKTQPFRIEPEIGQISEYSAKCPQADTSLVSQAPRARFQEAKGPLRDEAADIFDHHPFGVEDVDGARHVLPQAGSVAVLHAVTGSGDRDVLAGEARGEDVDGFDVGEVGFAEVAEVGGAGEAVFQDGRGGGEVVTVPCGRGAEDVVDGEVEAAVSGAE